METNEIVQYNKKIIAKQKKIHPLKQKAVKALEAVLSDHSELKELWEDNEELYMLAKKIDNCIERLENASTGVQSQITSLPQIFNKALKVNFFSGIYDCAKGSQYQKSMMELNEGKENILRTIRNNDEKIDVMKHEISDYEIKIQKLKMEVK